MSKNGMSMNCRAIESPVEKGGGDRPKSPKFGVVPRYVRLEDTAEPPTGDVLKVLGNAMLKFA